MPGCLKNMQKNKNQRMTSVALCWSNSVGSCFSTAKCFVASPGLAGGQSFGKKHFPEPKKELAYGTSMRCPNRRFCVHEPSGFRLVVGLGGGWLCFRGASVVGM